MQPGGRRWTRVALAAVLALLGPLPLPHVDTYLPAALGLFFALTSLSQGGGPVYAAYMAAVLSVYFGLAYLLVRGGEAVLARWRRSPRA